MPPTTDASARFDPTERSMPRVMITNSWPMARIAMTAVCDSTLPAFSVVKNTGERNDIATIRPTEDQDRTEPEHRQREPEEPEAPDGSIGPGRRVTRGRLHDRRQPRQPDRPSSCVPDRPRRSSNLSPRPLPRTINVA